MKTAYIIRLLIDVTDSKKRKAHNKWKEKKPRIGVLEPHLYKNEKGMDKRFFDEEVVPFGLREDLIN